MTDREKVLVCLEDAKNHPDATESHAAAVDALCDLLWSLGYRDVVEAYRQTER